MLRESSPQQFQLDTIPPDQFSVAKKTEPHKKVGFVSNRNKKRRISGVFYFGVPNIEGDAIKRERSRYESVLA